MGMWKRIGNPQSEIGNRKFFLTSSQWTLLQPILTSLRQEQAEYAEIRRAAAAFANSAAKYRSDVRTGTSGVSSVSKACSCDRAKLPAVAGSACKKAYE